MQTRTGGSRSHGDRLCSTSSPRGTRPDPTEQDGSARRPPGGHAQRPCGLSAPGPSPLSRSWLKSSVPEKKKR